MLPKTHAILGLVFSLIVFAIFPEIKFTGFLIIWFSSIFIDVDHYLYYVYKTRDLSLKNAYAWFVKRHNYFLKLSYRKRRKKINSRPIVPCVFHGFETALMLILLAYFIHSLFWLILTGIVFHQILDFIYILGNGYTFRHIGSQTYNILNYKKQKKL
ncbi:MAG: hypothetical protein QXI33_03510 [Candidatus Pacearchaeota archaeon]